MIATFAVVALNIIAANDVAAATISLHQDAVTSSVARRLFADRGKRMLTGSVASCTYAYLENPAVSLRDGRLFLRMHVVGQAGVNMRGSCVGGGDAFYTTVSGQPYVSAESVGLRDFRLDEGREMYRGLLEPLLRQQIPALIGLNLRDELTKLFQSHAPELKVTLTQFQLQEALARDGFLTVRFDFSLIANDGKP